MRWAWRTLFLVSLALLGAMACRATAYDLQFREGTRAFRAESYREALASFLRARAVDDGDSAVWAWVGDAASAVYRNPPAGGWAAARAEELMTTAWGGYAGAVLRSPLDTWSRSGLAEVSLLRAERRDAEHGVDLAEIDRRSGGTLDAWRAAAMVAATMAVELKPSGYQELDVLTRVYASAGQLDAARKSVVRSAHMMPAPSFHTWGNGVRFIKPLYDAIMTALREGLEKTPVFERSGLHLDIGRFAMEQDDLEGALMEMRAALAAASTPHDRYHALRGTAQVFEALGSLPEAIDAWGAVLEVSLAEPSDRRQRGVLEFRLGRSSDACRDMREALRAFASDAALRADAAAACELAGESDTAERLLREAFVDPTESPQLARGLLEFYRRNGKPASAAGLAKDWAREHPARSDFAAWADEFGGNRP